MAMKLSRVNPKGLLGNGEASIKRVQDQVDEFIEDLRAFDQVLWDVIDEYEEKVYKVLDAFGGTDGKTTNKQFKELKAASNRLGDSASGLLRDVQRGVKAVQQRRIRD